MDNPAISDVLPQDRASLYRELADALHLLLYQKGLRLLLTHYRAEWLAWEHHDTSP